MTQSTASSPKDKCRLVAITLDEGSIGRGNANVDHEREVAIYDLLDANTFKLEGRDDGPYRLELAIAADRLLFNVSGDSEGKIVTHFIPQAALRRIIKDYFMVLDGYYQAVRNAQPSRIQAIDVGRRGLHDEGGQVLIDRLAGKIEIDFDTARRLFTLITALHWKG